MFDEQELDNYEAVARIVVIGVGGAGNNAVNRMIDDNISTLPIVFTGGFSSLHGFDKIAKEKFVNNQSIHYLQPDAIGARSPSLSALVGALLASSKYKGSLSDQRARVAQVERLETKPE